MSPHYYGRDPWGRGAWFQRYGSGWGLTIRTRPQYIPSQPIIVTPVQPGVPEAPERPPVPTADDVAALPGVDLRGLLLYAADEFIGELDTISEGPGWKRYLQLDDLRRLVPAPATAPPPPEDGSEATPASETGPQPELLLPEVVRQELADILQRYDSTAANPEYRVISRMWGFQTIRVTLKELLVPPVQRLRRQLQIGSDLLEEELQQFETGSSWVGFLKLNEVRRLAKIAPADLKPEHRSELESLLVTFDRVADEREYQMISDLLGFRMLQHVTRSYLEKLRTVAPPAPPN